MDKCREAFEQIPEIKDSLSENIVFVGNKYTTANEGFYDLVNWLNGGWLTWQSRQAEVEEKDKRIERALLKWSSLASILTTTDMIIVPDDVFVRLDELGEALRGEHES